RPALLQDGRGEPRRLRRARHGAVPAEREPDAEALLRGAGGRGRGPGRARRLGAAGDRGEGVRMRELQTEIEIAAPAERVWQVLADFGAYPEWNPFIRRVTGEARTGARLEAHFQPEGARGMTFRPTVLNAEPNRELRWLGRLWLPGLFDGEHAFVLE